MAEPHLLADDLVIGENRAAGMTVGFGCRIGVPPRFLPLILRVTAR